jgi:TPR repeat protein
MMFRSFFLFALAFFSLGCPFSDFSAKAASQNTRENTSAEKKNFNNTLRCAQEKEEIPSCKVDLAELYISGRGTEKNEKEGLKWLYQSVNSGYDIGQLILGGLYEKGRAVEKNDILAAQLFRQAAEQGNNNARYALGIMYRDGRGVPQSNIEAYVRFSLVDPEYKNTVGDTAENEKKKLEKVMSADDKYLACQKIAMIRAVDMQHCTVPAVVYDPPLVLEAP